MRRVLAAAALAAVLVACGTPGGIGAEAAQRLQPWVDRIRKDAADGNARRAREAIAGLRADVAALQRDGAIDEDDAARVLNAATKVESDLAAITTTTTSPSTTRSTSTTTSASTSTSTSTTSTSTTTTTKPQQQATTTTKKKRANGDGEEGGGD